MEEATFSKVAGLLKVTLLHGCFLRFLILNFAWNRLNMPKHFNDSNTSHPQLQQVFEATVL